MNTLSLSLSISALLILSLGFSFQSSLFAQKTSTNANNNFIKNNNFGSSFQQVAATPPLITNISSKGIYKVELGFMTGVSVKSLPKHGFGTYITFMSATAPPATSETIPNKAAQSGGTTMGVGTQYNVPGSIKRIVAIKSFDMTVYDSHGNVLWNKVNLRPSAGLMHAEVVFPTETSGDITISIHNIESAHLNVPTDSVDFAAKVA
jgi:hypothetical protein